MDLPIRLQGHFDRLHTLEGALQPLRTIVDIPEAVEALIVEVADPRGPWGARGVGESPFLPLAPAVPAAIHEATGVWMNEIPVTPERMWRAIRQM